MIRVTHLLICICFILVSMPAAIADDVRNDNSFVSVEAAHVLATKAGGTAQLQFKITNNGNESVNLTSVRSNLTQVSRITIFDPYQGRQVIDDLSVQRDETLDLASSHIRVELINLTKDIKPGSTIVFELVFRKFSATAEAHVH
jgi:copper(I)-binding protein